MKRRPYVGYALAAIGTGGVLLEAALVTWTGIRRSLGVANVTAYEINSPVLVILAVVGFIGWYLISPKGAKDGVDIITDKATAIIVAVRSGRRSTDQFATVTVSAVEALGPAVVPKNPPPHPDGSAAPSVAGGDERTELDEG